jgi:hypothetical protein
LRHCATSRKVAGSIPDSVIGIDIILPAALWHGVDSGLFPWGGGGGGGKGGRCIGVT